MTKFCMCRGRGQPQEVMKEVFGLLITHVTAFGKKVYDGYECSYCGRLQFFRREGEEEVDPRQEKLKVIT